MNIGIMLEAMLLYVDCEGTYSTDAHPLYSWLSSSRAANGFATDTLREAKHAKAHGWQHNY
jgi:hypothetical protein